MNALLLVDRSLGCLLAGAAGDALGAPVEFLARAEILRRFGPVGIQSYAPAYGGIGRITDDTQMTLFTAEGCLAIADAAERGDRNPPDEIMRQAYLRWLATQGVRSSRLSDGAGGLIDLRELHSRRAPGNTCLTALSKEGGERNDSKGCGGIMRVAPCEIVHAGKAAVAPNSTAGAHHRFRISRSIIVPSRLEDRCSIFR